MPGPLTPAARLLAALALLSVPLPGAAASADVVPAGPRPSAGSPSAGGGLGEFPLTALEVAEITDPSGGDGDALGLAVAAGNDTVLVGQPGDDTVATNAGAARVWVRDGGGTWMLEATLQPAGLASSDEFGRSVALDGDVAAVGAPSVTFPTNSTGRVFVFRRSGSSWDLEATLTPAGGLAGDQFGRAVAIQGDRLVVGASHDDDGGSQSGSVFVFERSGGVWSQTAQLAAADPQPGDQFGRAVALDGDRLVVGAWLDDDAAGQAGTATIFGHDGADWMIEATLVPSRKALDDAHFGRTVSVSGTTVAVGAPDQNELTGGVYLFEPEEGADPGGTPVWVETHALVGGEPGLEFGASVGLDGDILVVGVPGDDTPGVVVGAVEVYTRRDGETFGFETSTLASGAKAGDRYGQAVAIGGFTVAAGAPGDDDVADDAGTAFVVELTLAGLWIDEGKGKEDGTGTVPVLTGEGSQLGGEPFTLTLTDAPASASTILVFGFEALCEPLKGGFLVPDPFLVIFGFMTDAEGALVVEGVWPDGTGPGFEAYLQYWIMDDDAACDFAASNGLQALSPPS